MDWLHFLALGGAVVFGGGVIVIAWLAFGISYTLNEMLILLKDQHEARCDAAALATERRTKRHTHLTEQIGAVTSSLGGDPIVRHFPRECAPNAACSPRHDPARPSA